MGRKDRNGNNALIIFMKKLMFIRWGALSPVNQKDRFVQDKDFIENNEKAKASWHRPPRRKGCYAFPWPYIEMFLVAWKLWDYDKETQISTRKKEFLHPRKFEYSGKLWTHFFINDPQIKYYQKRDSWYETDTDSLKIILKKHIWNLNNEGSRSDGWCTLGSKSFNTISRAHKVYSKDDFEVFIENPS